MMALKTLLKRVGGAGRYRGLKDMDVDRIRFIGSCFRRSAIITRR